MSEIFIGCSGFNYSDWKGNFYPPDLPQKKWLQYYCTVFDTVELNVTFYRVPLAGTFDKWYAETPSDFAFSLKGSRFITHIKRLLDPEEPLSFFFERALRLKEKLRVVLWQFSPGFKIDIDRLRKFVKMLGNYPVRNTFEFRNESWLTESVAELCAQHGISLCMADWPEFLDDIPVRADFVYQRRHGRGGNYASLYSTDDLRKDALRINGYKKNRNDVFMYFNNDFQGYAPRNAMELLQILKKKRRRQ